MKYILTVTIAFASLLNAQEAELPGWGIYLGAGMGSASLEESEGIELGYEPALPFIGVSKGFMLGVPLVVTVGLGKRSYNMDIDFFGYEMSQGVSMDYLDIGAQMPYPLGPGFAQIGALFGTPLGGKVTVDMDGDEASEDIDSGDLDPDYGLMFSYSYPISEQLSVTPGYYLGLAEQSDGGPKFNGIFLLLGYTF